MDVSDEEKREGAKRLQELYEKDLDRKSADLKEISVQKKRKKGESRLNLNPFRIMSKYLVSSGKREKKHGAKSRVGEKNKRRTRARAKNRIAKKSRRRNRGKK